MKLNILNLKNKTQQELNELLATLNEKQTQDLKEQQEYYLLCYPQGTGDLELEELLSNLDLLWYPDSYPEYQPPDNNSTIGGEPMTQSTQFPDYEPVEKLNTWWGLSTVIQDQVKKLVPDKDTWTLDMTKTKSGDWVFSLPQFLTFNESMCNGTEKVMDYWFEQKIGYVPVIGSKMKVTVSKVKPDSFDTKILWMYEDPLWPQSNFYLDKGSGMDVWLCPYVQVLFKEVPDGMWITFNPII